MADAGVPVGYSIERQVAEDTSQKDRNFPPGDDLGQRHAGEDVDGGEQGSAAGSGEGAGEGADAIGINPAAPFECGADNEARGLR